MTNVQPETVVPPTSPFGRVYQTCRNLLDLYVDYYDRMGLPTLPENQFVANGQVTYDGEIVAVELLRLRPGKPGIPSLTAIEAGGQYSIEVAVHNLRNIPTPDEAGEGPSPEAIEKSTRTLMLDWWAFFDFCISQTVVGYNGGPSLSGPPYRSAMIQEILPHGPEGDIGGHVAHLVLELA